MTPKTVPLQSFETLWGALATAVEALVSARQIIYTAVAMNAPLTDPDEHVTIKEIDAALRKALEAQRLTGLRDEEERTL